MKNYKFRYVHLISAIGFMLCVNTATAQEDRFAAETEQRIKLFNHVRDELKVLRIDMKENGTPDWEKTHSRTQQMDASGQALLNLFPKGSDKNSRARARIWKNQDDFNQRMQTFSQELSTLNMAAKTKDVSGLQDSVNKVTATCKSCHRKYRTVW